MSEKRNTFHETGTITESKPKLKKPLLYQVLLHNDNYTTREFVVFVLESVFGKGEAEATRIMMHVHTRGIGVCGLYPLEVAETKVAQVSLLAEKNEFPLLCTKEEA